MNSDDHKFTLRNSASKVQQQIHFVIVVAVDVERDAVLEIMVPLHNENGILKVLEGDAVYYAGSIGLYNCVLVMCQMGASGRDGSILATNASLVAWKPTGGIIMVGIAFGRHKPIAILRKPQKQVIGDVIVATQIIPYESKRIGLIDEVQRGAHPEASLLFLNRLRNLRWTWTPELNGQPTSPRSLQFGSLLSGEKLVDNLDFKKKLFKELPKAVGGEMEGAGVYAAASRENTAWVVVKAICDWGDGKKSKDYQELAARNAAAVIRAMLEEPELAPVSNEIYELSNSAIIRNKIELIRRADEIRQSKSESLARLLASSPKNDDGTFGISPNVKPMFEIMKSEQEVAFEQWLNAYEDACGEFLAGGIENKLFKASLGEEIRELVEKNGPQQDRLQPRETSPYKSIHATYDALYGGSIK